MQKPSSRTVPQLLDEMAQRRGSHVFIVDEERRATYEDVRREARALAKSLHTLGVRRGDRVALLMDNRLEWLQVDFAAALLGAILVAVPTWWRRSEIDHALTLSGASVLVMVDRFGSNDYTAEVAALGDLKAKFPLLQHVVCLGGNLPPGAMPFARFAQLGQEVDDAVIDAAAAAVMPEDPSLILFTSGSTSKPKAAQLVHRGLVENPFNIGERMHLTGDDRVLLVSSMFWSVSCCNALFNVMTHGATLVLSRGHDPATILRLLQDERCTAFYTLPNIVHSVYQHPGREKYDISHLRTGICRSEVIDLLVEMGANDFCTTYGLTEGYGHSCMTDGLSPLALRRRCGGFPLPGTEVQIVDLKTREPLAPGALGEVRIRGYVTPGYYGDPQRTRESIDADGWLYTGDLAVMDENGFRFQGRIKEMIKTGGINVTPAEVEELLQSHPDVLQAVVVGVPDPVRDEVVAAMVVPRAGRRIDLAALTDYCRTSAAVYKTPRFIDVRSADEIPLTDTGKVSKLKAQEVLSRLYKERAQ